MNRRSFLMGSAAAAIAPALPPALPSFSAVQVTFTLDATAMTATLHRIEDLVVESIRKQIEREVYEAFFYGDGVGEPSGILTSTNPAAEHEKPARMAIEELYTAGGHDLRGYEHLFTPKEPDPGVLTAETLREAMKKLDSHNPRRGKSMAALWQAEFAKIPENSAKTA